MNCLMCCEHPVIPGEDLCPFCEEAQQAECMETVPPRSPVERPSQDELISLWSRMDRHDWGEGLGLMDPEERENHLKTRAEAVYMACRLQGLTAEQSWEEAMGTRKYRGRQP